MLQPTAIPATVPVLEPLLESIESLLFEGDVEFDPI